MNLWQFIISKPATGRKNMTLDLDNFREALQPTIRIYSWKNKCISVGYGQKIDRLLDGSMARDLGWEIVKRPTGGGIVFHNQAEVTFSVVAGLEELPQGLIPSYMKISEGVVEALKLVGIEAEISRKQNVDRRAQNSGMCFSYPAEYEIVCQGKKIVGSAQKRNRNKLLQQGSIFMKSSGQEGENAISVEEVLGRGVSFTQMAEALKLGFKRTLCS